MDPREQKRWFRTAYALGEQRLAAGYGWPLTVDPQVAAFVQRIKRELPGGRALDIGCGQGRHTISLAEQGYEAYGIDYISRAIREARAAARGLNAHFKVMDLFSLRFPPAFFDLVLDWSVLDHIKPADWPRYLRSVLRALKPGGFLVLCEFSANDPRVKGKARNFSESRSHYNHFFRRSELRALFSPHFEFVAVTETLLKQRPQFVMVNALLKRTT